jgi:uncharacterized short protein YbdD (DUF466 family)
MIVVFLLDETGSMMSVRDATISGFNEYIDTLTQRSPDALFSLRLFSSEKYAVLAQLTPIALAPRLNYNNYAPGGGTPLYDSIARLVRETETSVSPMTPPPEVLFVIMTDGEENASREFTRERIFALIKAKEETGWSFVYLGANQDAWQVGASIGVNPGRSMQYDANQSGTRVAFNMMAGASDRYLQKRREMRAESPNVAPPPREDEFFSDDDASRLGKRKPGGRPPADPADGG